MNLRSYVWVVAVVGMLAAGVTPGRAQDKGNARAILTVAMNAELAADVNDRSRWKYKDDQQDLGMVSIVVQTDKGSVKRLISKGGRPLSEADAKAEDARVQSFIHDPAAIEKQKNNAAQDDKSATELLKMLPEAFLWKMEREDAEKWTLHFEPNPNFSPPDIQSRVLGTMAGELVVDRQQHRIETISGRLTQDVMIGWGLLGRLKAGGTFRVERRQVAPGFWQITETHVHIEGKALFFKNIGQHQDEVQTEFARVPGGMTLEQAAEMSKSLK
jgi:hypothetical protein